MRPPFGSVKFGRFAQTGSPKIGPCAGALVFLKIIRHGPINDGTG